MTGSAFPSPGSWFWLMSYPRVSRGCPDEDVHGPRRRTASWHPGPRHAHTPNSKRPGHLPFKVKFNFGVTSTRYATLPLQTPPSSTFKLHVAKQSQRHLRSGHTSQDCRLGPKTEKAHHPSFSSTCSASRHHRDLLGRRRKCSSTIEEASNQSLRLIVHQQTGLSFIVGSERRGD